jgi:hypothetical protein
MNIKKNRTSQIEKSFKRIWSWKQIECAPTKIPASWSVNMPNSIVKEHSKKKHLLLIYWLCPNTRGKRLGISERFFQRKIGLIMNPMCGWQLIVFLKLNSQNIWSRLSSPSEGQELNQTLGTNPGIKVDNCGFKKSNTWFWYITVVIK